MTTASEGEVWRTGRDARADGESADVGPRDRAGARGPVGDVPRALISFERSRPSPRVRAPGSADDSGASVRGIPAPFRAPDACRPTGVGADEREQPGEGRSTARLMSRSGAEPACEPRALVIRVNAHPLLRHCQQTSTDKHTADFKGDP